jgi:hypothetical protein
MLLQRVHFGWRSRSVDGSAEQASSGRRGVRDDRAAMQAGLADFKAGRVRAFGEFDQDFRSRNRISCDEQQGSTP